MIGLRLRRVPERHHAVAQELVNGALVAKHDLGHDREQLVEDRDRLLRIEALAQRREADHIGEHHRDLLAPATQAHVLLAADHPIDQLA